MKRSDIQFVFKELSKRYAGATTELTYQTPFQLLVAVIMSAQTTDKQVNKVTATFFDSMRSPKDIITLSLEQWESMIQGVNYYRNKARNIYKLATILSDSAKGYKNNLSSINSQQSNSQVDKIMESIKKRGYWIPDTQDELVRLPGVGEKTAKVILQVLYGHAVIAVDTHVHRVTNRLGIVKTKEPLQTSKILENIVPKEYRADAHHALILFGRYHCIARNPKCSDCPFITICQRYKNNKIIK